MVRAALTLPVFMALALASACAPEVGDPGGMMMDGSQDQEPGTGMTGGDPLVTIATSSPNIYSGYDGSNTYRLPILALSSNAGSISWTVDNPAVAATALAVPPEALAVNPREGEDASWLMITPSQVGETKIRAEAGGISDEITLYVSAYTPAQVDTGRTLYNSNANGESCASCHQSAGGVEHSPFFQSYLSDGQITDFIQTGKVELQTLTGETYLYEATAVEHVFAMNDQEAGDLAAYLRSIPPPGFQ